MHLQGVKTGLIVLLITLFSCVAFGLAAEPASPSESLQWSPGEFKKLKSTLEFENEALSQPDMKLQDVRISPLIRYERWYEIPIEIGFHTAEDGIVSFMKKAHAYSLANATLGHKAITISQTAETLPNGKQLLSVIVSQALVVGQAPLNRHSENLVKGLDQILRQTTFEPRVRRGGGEVAKSAPHWITNLRIDSDLRFQITGYGLSLSAVTELAEKLFDSTIFIDVNLNSATRVVFEKQPIWRFDLVARVSAQE